MKTEASVYIHPAALVESDDIGAGSRVWAFAHVMKGAQVGAKCNIGDHAFVESGAILGDRVTVKNGVMVWDGVALKDDVFVGPGAIFTNDRMPRSPRMDSKAVQARYKEPAGWLSRTTVERGASIGAGAVIVAGLSIGEYAMVAAGAVVTRDVAPHTLVQGNPAKPAGLVCRCGSRLPKPSGNGAQCSHCKETYRLRGKTLVRG